MFEDYRGIPRQARFLVYAGILILLSLPFVLLYLPGSLGWTEFPYNVWPFT